MGERRGLTKPGTFHVCRECGSVLTQQPHETRRQFERRATCRDACPAIPTPYLFIDVSTPPDRRPVRSPGFRGAELDVLAILLLGGPCRSEDVHAESPHGVNITRAALATLRKAGYAQARRLGTTGTTAWWVPVGARRRAARLTGSLPLADD